MKYEILGHVNEKKISAGITVSDWELVFNIFYICYTIKYIKITLCILVSLLFLRTVNLGTEFLR